jgi:hypothetical protein
MRLTNCQTPPTICDLVPVEDVRYNGSVQQGLEVRLARRSTQKRRPAQILFLILSLLVVLSMALAYVLTALPAPPQPTPTPTQVPLVSLVAPLIMVI